MHVSTVFLHTSVGFSFPYGGRASGCDDCAPLSEEKFVTAVTTIRRSFRDVLNVLLNAAIVSTAVHRAHKFISAAPPRSFCRFVLTALKDRDREGEHVPPSFQRRRYTKIPPALYSTFGHQSAFSNFHSRGNGKKIVYLAGQKRHSYAKTCLG